MNEIVPNSHKFKEKERKEKTRMGPVTTGSVQIEKPSFLERVVTSFITTDAVTLRDYIFNDVLIPSIKKGIIETVNMIFYNTPIVNRGGSQTRTQYGGFINSGAKPTTTNPTRKPNSNGFSYDNITFEERGQAEMVLNAMIGAIQQYDAVSVLDLYDLSGITTDNFNADKYGWTNLSTADIVRGPNGYNLKLPPVVLIS